MEKNKASLNICPLADEFSVFIFVMITNIFDYLIPL